MEMEYQWNTRLRDRLSQGLIVIVFSVLILHASVNVEINNGPYHKMSSNYR